MTTFISPMGISRCPVGTVGITTSNYPNQCLKFRNYVPFLPRFQRSFKWDQCNKPLQYSYNSSTNVLCTLVIWAHNPLFITRHNSIKREVYFLTWAYRNSLQFIVQCEIIWLISIFFLSEVNLILSFYLCILRRWQIKFKLKSLALRKSSSFEEGKWSSDCGESSQILSPE